MKSLYKLLTLFVIGGLIYVLVELGFRGYSHWTMFFLGGVCFLLIGKINEVFSWEMAFWKQSVIGAAIITTLEFIFGIILNVYLNLNIWDYHDMPFNILGQVCLPFTFAWVFLSAIAIVLDDWIRYLLFKEEKPHYKLF